MILNLERYSYGPDETEGILHVADQKFYTIERPWLENRREVSCIPEGYYDLKPWTRPSGERAFILENPAYNVFRSRENAGDDGRYLILLHAGNVVRDVIGCIAVGLRRGVLYSEEAGRYERAVKQSRLAMGRLRQILDWDLGNQHLFVIRQIPGAYLR